MKRIVLLALAACMATGALALVTEKPDQADKANKADKTASPATLSAAEIIEKNAAARGGVEAWRKINSMATAGRIESANVPGREMPFTLEQKRPSSTRFMVTAQNQKSLRVFNGSEGWKLKPDNAGRPELLAYTADELRFARDSQVIDGPLMDDAARHGAITVMGIDMVDGRRNYVLGVKLPSGASHRVWVDAQTFLESRFERDVRLSTGQVAISTLIFRDYRLVEGLLMPMTIETGGEAGRARDKLIVEKVALNPELIDRTFTKPVSPMHRRNGVTVDARPAGPTSPANPSSTP